MKRSLQSELDMAGRPQAGKYIEDKSAFVICSGQGIWMSKEKVLAHLKEIAKRFDDPKIQKRFVGYNKTLQFVFPDINTSMYLKIGDGKVLAVGEGVVPSELQVTMDSTVFLGIMAKTESPMAAYSAGKLKTKGEVPDLLKLQKLLL